MASGLRLSGRKALLCMGGGAAGLLWPVPLQRVQGTICGGSGSAERMRIVPRPRQVGHWEGMGLLGCVDADRAACSRAGRAVKFRQCHGRHRAIWFCVPFARSGAFYRGRADCPAGGRTV